MSIIKQNAAKTVWVIDAGEGNQFASLALLEGTGSSRTGRFVVCYGEKEVKGLSITVPNKHYCDFLCDALSFYRFQCEAEIYRQAKEAGLDDATSELVALGKMTLEEALGDADQDAEELHAWEEELHEEMQGGEEDNLPPIEEFLASGYKRCGAFAHPEWDDEYQY